MLCALHFIRQLLALVFGAPFRRHLDAQAGLVQYGGDADGLAGAGVEDGGWLYAGLPEVHAGILPEGRWKAIKKPLWNGLHPQTRIQLDNL